MAKEIDSLDLEILDLLKKDSKIKLHILSKKLKIPSSTIHFRLQKLESLGYFKYSILENYKKLGYTIKAFVIVYVNPKDLRLIKRNQSDLSKLILKINGVQSVDIITGEGDLLLILRAKTIEDLNKLILEKIQILDGIKNTKTLISLEENNS